MGPLLLVFVAAELFELRGRIEPPARASVSIHRVQSPFATATLADDDGKFTFKKLEAGAYTVTVFMPSRGEVRRTVEVGTGQAVRNRVAITLNLKDSDFVFRDSVSRTHAVSAKQLSIPGKALREYEAAQKALAKNEIAEAERRIEKAVDLAPHFATAWNHLGTMAYQTQRYARAAECFRESLAQDPQLYEPLVNLGGVLLNLNQPDEAFRYNQHAVLTRPNDALANSQFGMTYWHLGNAEMAEKYLRRAVELDPAHFSHPQLLLADIRMKRGEFRAAADELESFLRHHPDWKQAEAMRARIAEWRK